MHGTLWLDLDKLEKLVKRNGRLVQPEKEDDLELKPLKGIKSAFKSLRSNKDLTKKDVEVLANFANEFTTVTSHPSIVGKDVSTIAKEVNLHHHTHTCRKYNNDCRFGFEKLPSPETLIAQPVKGSTETKKDTLKKCHETIKRLEKYWKIKMRFRK